MMLRLSSRLLASFISSRQTKAVDQAIYIASNARVRQCAGIKPLRGIKIAILNRPSIGEFTASVLEDYGASIQRLCEPLQPDQWNESHGRLLNLNKREDVDLVSNVSRQVDIFIDYLHEQRLEHVGLDPQQMIRVNPQLILARISGFGLDGELGRKIGADANFGGCSGTMSPIQPTDDALKLATAEAKVLTLAGRSHVVTGVVMALFEREHTGKGQVIDFNVTNAISYVHEVAAKTALQIPEAFNQFYRTSDGKVVAVGILRVDHQKRLLEVLNIDKESQLKSAIKAMKQDELLEKCKDICTITPVYA
ncbi:Alpha-methylacyl-CoA racemase isoform X1 [Aphelenchoides besseyi]|nr:Alpha-methylacyl-CoA racemase isoform X1 [Aphelenchoides besseyi]